jgi:hypothetical protein
MKRKSIILSMAFTAAIASCGGREEEEWTDGKENGRYRDTTANGRPYRHYGGFWYPIVAGRIAPGLYRGASGADIVRPGFTPMRSAGSGSRGIRSGGFGRSVSGRGFGG